MLRRYYGKISFLPLNQFKGHDGELVIDDQTGLSYVMDGNTYGGHPLSLVTTYSQTAPTNPTPGTLWFNPVDKVLNIFDGNIWDNAAQTYSNANVASYLISNPITGNIGFNNDIIFDSNGVNISNQNLTHGATSSLIIPTNGSNNPLYLTNNYGDVIVTSGITNQTQFWRFGDNGLLSLPPVNFGPHQSAGWIQAGDGTANVGISVAQSQYQFTTSGLLLDDSVTAAGLIQTSNAPTNNNNRLWYNSQDGRLYVSYNNQWVDASPQLPVRQDILINGSYTLNLDPSGIVSFPNLSGSQLFINGGTLGNTDSEAADKGISFAPANTNGPVVILNSNGGLLLELSNGTNNQQFSFNDDGSFMLPSGGSIKNSDGSPYGASFSGNIGANQLVFDDSRIGAPAVSGANDRINLYPTASGQWSYGIGIEGSYTWLNTGQGSQGFKFYNQGTLLYVLDSGALYPYTNGTLDSGTATYPWRDGHFAGTVNVGNSLYFPQSGQSQSLAFQINAGANQPLGTGDSVTFAGIAVSSEIDIGTQRIFAHPQGFSVNENFDITNQGTQENFAGYHFASGSGIAGTAFTLARTGHFTDGFGVTGDENNNYFVIGSEQGNTDFVFKNHIGMPFDVSGGNTLLTIGRDGTLQFSSGKKIRVVNAPTHSTGASGDLQGDIAFDNNYIYYCLVDNITTPFTIIQAVDTNSSPYIYAPIASCPTTPQAGWYIQGTLNGSPQLVIHSVTTSGSNYQLECYYSGSPMNSSIPAGYQYTITPVAGNIWKRVAWSSDTW